jgi:CheY-like chemotaxis protein
VRGSDAALRHILEHQFSVILMDIRSSAADGRMGTEGFDFAKVIKQRERSRTTPIIFVTAADADHQYLQQGYDAGAADFVSAPFDPTVVRAKIELFAQLSRNTRLFQWQLEETRRLCDRLEQRYGEILTTGLSTTALFSPHLGLGSQAGDVSH